MTFAETRAAAIKSFRCPRHEGLPVPCKIARHGQGRVPQLEIYTPETGVVECPIHATEGCLPHEELEVAIELWRHKRLKAVGSALGIPPRLLLAALDWDPRTAALDRVTAYLDNDEAEDGHCLVLMGPTGTGKSWAAAAGLRAWHSEHPGSTYARLFPDLEDNAADDRYIHRGQFVYFPALCMALLDPQRRPEAMAVGQLKGLVVFDDFGTEYVKSGGLLEAFVDELIWYREGHLLPTILTTNLDEAAFRQRLSERIVDRLRGEWGHIFQCPGESLRKPICSEKEQETL